MTPADDLLLPPGTRLLHIGPQKTGTSAVQDAFHSARESLAGQGVHYAGSNRQPRQAALAAAEGSTVGIAGRTLKQAHWQGLVREVQGSKAPRIVISSEDFADAEPAAIRRVIDAFDPTRVHVVVTLRPLARILPSQWQQLVQGGVTTSYADWLATIFDEPTSGAATRFWHRHRHNQLIARWAAVVGPGNVTAIVVDDREPEGVLRSFERLLGLRERTLRAADLPMNRSLTVAEIELVRAAHATFRDVGLEASLRHDLVSRGIAASLKLRRPGGDERRVETPAREQQRVLAASREIVEGITASGVRVLGDLELLAEASPRTVAAKAHAPGKARAGARTHPALGAWPAIAGRGLVGVVLQTGLARRAGASGGPGAWPDGETAPAAPRRSSVDVSTWSTPRLASQLYGRVRSLASLARRIHAGSVRPTEGAE